MRARPKPAADGGSDQSGAEAEERDLFSVWDEPTLARVLPADRRPQSFRKWWEAHAARTSAVCRISFLLFISVLAGPVSVITTFVETALRGGLLVVSVVGMVFLGPAIEEIAKTVLLALAIEAKPYMFRRRLEILLCGLCSALGFAAIENVLYLEVYIEDPTRAIALWRWTVCVGMHAIATLLTATGLAREWARAWEEGRRPEPGRAFAWLVAATAFHGIYNAAVLVEEWFDLLPRV